jgi:hypothetical protein
LGAVPNVSGPTGTLPPAIAAVTSVTSAAGVRAVRI